MRVVARDLPLSKVSNQPVSVDLSEAAGEC